MADANPVSEPQKPVRRDLGIDTLRGLAVLLVVVGHVIGVTGTAGLEVEDNSVWRKLYLTMSPFSMPMFALIAGYVYALRPAKRGEIAVFIKKKFQRIVVPLLWVTVLTYAVRRYALGVVELQWWEVWRLWVFMYDHFWFLHVLLLLFAWAALVDVLGWMNHWGVWLAWLAAWVVLSHESPNLAKIDPDLLLLFSIPTLWSVAPAFVVGIGLKRFETLHRKEVVVGVVAAAVVLMLAYHWRLWSTNLKTLGHVNALGRGSDLGMATGMFACWALMYWRGTWWPLSSLARFGYTIYLFHLFGTAGMRVVLEKLGIHDMATHLILGTVAGVALPMAIHPVLKRFKWLGVA